MKRIDQLNNNELDRNQSKTNQEILRILDPKIIIKKLKENSQYLPSAEEIKYAFENCTNPYQEWDAFIHENKNKVYEIITQEYLSDLANYLVEKYKEDKKIKILEVGAGNGKLTHHLRNYLKKQEAEKFEIVATDSGEWGIETIYEVEQIEIEEAIKKHKPNVIICSWMPLNEDFTEIFRKYENIIEYLLIGDPDVCGDQWKTYGNKPYYLDEEYSSEFEYEDEEGWYYDNYYGLDEDEDEDEENIKNQGTQINNTEQEEEQQIPYEREGFECQELRFENQICRSDYPGNYSHSKTLSFTKKQ